MEHIKAFQNIGEWAPHVHLMEGACRRVKESISPVFEQKFFEAHLPKVVNGAHKVSDALQSLEGRVVLSRTNATIALMVVNVLAPLGFIWLLVEASANYQESKKFPSVAVSIYGIHLLALLIFNVLQMQNINNSVSFSKVKKIAVPKTLSSAYEAVSHTINRIVSDQGKIARLTSRITRYKELLSKYSLTPQTSPLVSSDATSSATTTSSSDADDEEEEDDLESGLVPSQFRARIVYGKIQYVKISDNEE